MILILSHQVRIRVQLRTQLCQNTVIFTVINIHNLRMFAPLADQATGWTIGVLGFDFRRGLGIFLFTAALRPTQPPIQWVAGALSLGVKRPGREVNHSPPSSAEVKNEWSYTSTSQYVSMALCLVKHRDNFTFTFTFTFATLSIYSEFYSS
jgi:hypothetical protein